MSDLAIRESEEVIRLRREIVGLEQELQAAKASLSRRCKWNAIKQRLGGKRAEIIDLLLVQNEMTITQVGKALRSHYNTAQNLLQDLHGQGVLIRNGNAYSLKR